VFSPVNTPNVQCFSTGVEEVGDEDKVPANARLFADPDGS
jgi:hypothetical protein